jgi:hypothetical protein
MAIRNDFAPGEVLAAADLNDTFGSKLPIAGGKILQVVRATDSTQRSTTSTSFTDVTGMSVTITPQKSDSAILIIATGSGAATRASAGDTSYRYQITDNSNNAISGAENSYFGSFSGNSQDFTAFTIIGRSTPAVITAVTYKLRFRVDNAAITNTLQNNAQTGQMYAIEVSA